MYTLFYIARSFRRVRDNSIRSGYAGVLKIKYFLVINRKK